MMATYKKSNKHFCYSATRWETASMHKLINLASRFSRYQLYFLWINGDSLLRNIILCSANSFVTLRDYVLRRKALPFSEAYFIEYFSYGCVNVKSGSFPEFGNVTVRVQPICAPHFSRENHIYQHGLRI